MIPKRYKDIAADDWAKKIARMEQSVLMIGGVGVGKTYKAAQIYNIFGKSRDFIDVSEYLREANRRKWLKTTDASERYREWIDEVMNAKLLVLDDLGIEKADEQNASIIREIIQRRYNDASMTIITTNLNGKELEARYSARLISRVYEDYQVIVMKGADRRRDKMSVFKMGVEDENDIGKTD